MWIRCAWNFMRQRSFLPHRGNCVGKATLLCAASDPRGARGGLRARTSVALDKSGCLVADLTHPYPYTETCPVENIPGGWRGACAWLCEQATSTRLRGSRTNCRTVVAGSEGASTRLSQASE